MNHMSYSHVEEVKTVLSWTTDNGRVTDVAMPCGAQRAWLAICNMRLRGSGGVPRAVIEHVHCQLKDGHG